MRGCETLVESWESNPLTNMCCSHATHLPQPYSSAPIFDSPPNVKMRGLEARCPYPVQVNCHMSFPIFEFMVSLVNYFDDS